ncbi:hypothetical protein OQA88_2127 [Cercophora sp. LCS_1]
MANPSTAQITGVKTVLHYLKGHRDLGMTYHWPDGVTMAAFAEGTLTAGKLGPKTTNIHNAAAKLWIETMAGKAPRSRGLQLRQLRDQGRPRCAGADTQQRKRRRRVDEAAGEREVREVFEH